MFRNIRISFTLGLIALALPVMYQDAQARDLANTAVNAQQQRAAPDIAFTVSMARPWTHLLEVEMRVRWQQMPAALELKMPVWTPGSYLVREYARHVQDFEAKGGGDLAWEKINKNTWRVTTNGQTEIVAKYKVYANELTVRTNELNDDHAFWNNAGLLLFPKGQLAAPSTVKVVPYKDWKVATGLPETAPNTFRAENYDILYDSPFEVSNFREITFTSHGKPHRIVMSGPGNYNADRLAADMPKIVEEGYKILGELPYDNYTFLVNLRTGSGGLEHLNSTALVYDRLGFQPVTQYKKFLHLAAHEYFHLWNVKRIRPDALGPFDYETENYTKNLWFAEGATAYYEAVLLRRAGLISEKEMLAEKARMIEQLQARPGRFETSLEDASFDAWIKYYRQDENAVNNQISYYDKGEIVNMMLDLTIREASGGERSLDDVLRYLYNDFYKKNRNYTPADLQKAAERAAGKSLDDFFARYVRGTADLDYNAILAGVGLQIKDTRAEDKAYLGADLREENGRLTVRSVPAGTPAYEQGLNAGDQIVAVDGYRAGLASFQTYLGNKRSNDKVKLTVFRFDKLRDIDITLGTNARPEFAIVPVENPSDEQRRLYGTYTGAEL